MERTAKNLWYKDAVIYGIDVATFQDSNGDGVGDFPGICQRLDYLSGLGITCLWLLPFFPTPNRDNGYDVTNYYEIDPRLGSFDDLLQLVHRAGERGIRIIIDLVMDHTSDQHPWFRAARHDRHSRYRRYYEWSDAPPPADPDHANIFPGEEAAVWSYDDVAGQYYYHRFYHFEPDLNVMRREVQEEVEHVIDYWLSFGISGFRMDAVSHMIESPHQASESSLAHDPHEVIRELRRYTSNRRPDAVLLGEADVEPAQLQAFFGDGDQLHMLYNFSLTNYLFLALARQRAEPIERALRLLPPVPTSGQWVNFLRNFDELDLERLSDEERRMVYEEFAPDDDMRIFGRGIRRRVAPMLGDERRLRLAYSLLFSLPGTPLFMYGDEIGMGDDLSLHGRNAVRTPMQWSTEPNAGFSSSSAKGLPETVVSKGPFAYHAVNVADHARDSKSLLTWMKRLIHLRRQCPEWGWGRTSVLDSGDPGVFAHRADWQGRVLVACHNLTDTSCSVQVPLESGGAYEPIWSSRLAEAKTSSAQLEIDPHGYGWYRLVRQ